MRFSKFGVTEYDRSRATPGLTLFSPLLQKTTYLIDMDGAVVHKWDLEAPPGNYSYLLKNGNLMTAVQTPGGPVGFNAKGGKIQELYWHGNVIW